MSVLFYLFSNIIILIKLLLLLFTKIFLFTNVSKIVIIFILVLILRLFKKYPRTRFKKLSQLRRYKYNLIMKYALRTKKDHIINLAVLFTGFCLFFVCLALLRFYNKEKNLDLLEKKQMIYDLYLNTGKYDFLLASVIFVLIFMVYILSIIRSVNYFRYHVIKRHLYLIGNDHTPQSNDWYLLVFFQKFLDRINIYNIHFNLCFFKIPDLYEKLYFDAKIKPEPDNFDNFTDQEQRNFYNKSPVHPHSLMRKYKLDTILLHFMTKWHYFLLLVLFFYDVFYNNYNIHLVFNVLPWTLFFDFHLRVSKFVNDLYIAYDTYINAVIYSKTLEVIDDDTWLVDGEIYDYGNFKKIYRTYIRNNFVKNVNEL